MGITPRNKDGLYSSVASRYFLFKLLKLYLKHHKLTLSENTKNISRLTQLHR